MSDSPLPSHMGVSPRDSSSIISTSSPPTPKPHHHSPNVRSQMRSIDHPSTPPHYYRSSDGLAIPPAVYSQRPSYEKMTAWERRDRMGSLYSDLEKGSYDRSSHGSSNSTIMTSMPYEENEEVDQDRTAQENNATKILLFMSGPCVALSTVNAVWTVLAILITTLTQPLRFSSSKPSFGQYLIGLLAPALRTQLRCIYALLPPTIDGKSSYLAGKLCIVHILSPVLSFAMMFASWTLAVYWVTSTIVGDPAGQDKRDDGKETVLGLRNCWETWLMKSLRKD